MREVLAFVIAGAAREEGMAVDARFERRGFPEVERLGRLDVIVPVDEKVWATSRFWRARKVPPCRFCDDDRIPVGRTKPSVETDALAIFKHPFGTSLEVGLMLRLGGDAGETEVIAQLVNGTSFVFFEVIKDSLHAQSFSRENTGSKSDQSMNH